MCRPLQLHLQKQEVRLQNVGVRWERTELCGHGAVLVDSS
jgi:hypothetical protein